MANLYDLERFVIAQDRINPDSQKTWYETARRELRNGRKQSHWIWFVFPQRRELGYTETAKFFGIASRDEAVAYLAHDVLGPRLHDCAQLVIRPVAGTAKILLGDDSVKLKSSMTLFAEVAADNEDFVNVLRRRYDGQRDRETLKLLKGEPAELTAPSVRHDVEVIEDSGSRRGFKRWWLRGER